MKGGLASGSNATVDAGQIRIRGDTASLIPATAPTIPSGLDERVSDAAYASEQSWSFDAPATLYMESKYLPQRPAGAFTQFASSQFPSPPPPRPPAPAQAQQQTPPASTVTQTSPLQQIDFHSPSDSGTNDSWPPLISTDQVGWRIALGASTTTSPPPPSIQSVAGMGNKQPLPGSGSPFGIGSGFPSDQINIPQLQQTSGRNDSVMLDIDWVSWAS
jgi:hypothetical protein